MTEDVITTDMGSSSSEPVQSSSNDSSAPQEAAQEKLLPQSEVNRIVGKTRQEAYEKAKRDFDKGMQQNSQVVPQTQYQDQARSLGGIQQYSPDQIRQLIQEEAYKMSNQAVANKMLQDYGQKIEAVKSKYADFDEKYKALDIDRHPELIYWTNGLDNTGDVMYDIASNPEKVAQVLMLANSGFPQLAQQKLQSLSASIKKNEEAKSQPVANEPLSQISPSNIGADNGTNSVSDLRKASWLRG